MDLKHVNVGVSPAVKRLLNIASMECSKRETGELGTQKAWITKVLIEAALTELGYDTLEEWVKTQSDI